MVLLGEPCRKHHRFSYVLTYLNRPIIWQFWKISIRNVWNISYGYNCKFIKRWRWKNILFLSLDITWMKWYTYVYWARRLFILSCVSAENCRASASEREWWCRSADKHRWTCVHRVWAPTNTAKRDWASYNCDKACCFRTNAATEPPLDQSRSYCCRTWAQLSVSWRTTAVIPWKWKKNRHILWRSSAVLKLAVSRRFSSKNRQCVIVALRLTLIFFLRKHNIYLLCPLLSCLDTEVAQVVEILPRGRQGPVFLISPRHICTGELGQHWFR